MDLVRQHFYEVSLEYVFKVQEVQERKMFEFVEPVSRLMMYPYFIPTPRSNYLDYKMLQVTDEEVDQP